MLHPQAFLQIQQRWGPLVVDLFASSLTIYPAAEILQLETKPRGRCFQSGLDTTPGEDVCQPPVEPGGESPEQSLPAEDHASPGCPSVEELQCPSVEEPMLLESLVDFPILLPQRADLIILTHPESVPEMMSRLAAWHISGGATRIRIFRKRAQSCSSRGGDRSLPSRMTPSSESGSSVVVDGVQIPFRVLSVKW